MSSGRRPFPFGRWRRSGDRLADVHRPLLALACVLILTSCRVDVAVDVDMEQNGSGRVMVTVDADAAVVTQAPGLADDVRLEDVRAAGWSTDGAVATPSGGLQLVLTRSFDTPEQGTAILATLNGPSGPLQAIALTRSATDTSITAGLSGSLRVDGGLDAFADPDLLAVVGATPWAENITEAGLTTDRAVSVTFRATLPGEIIATTAEERSAVALGGAPPDDSTVTTGATGATGASGATTLIWTPPLDGSQVDLASTTSYSLERGGIWSVLSSLALLALVAWVLASIVVIGWVTRAHHRRADRRADRAGRPPA